MRRGLILFAHGSRDPEWARPFRRVQEKVVARRPQLTVELAFLELMEPSLEKAIESIAASGCDHVSIAPLFMAHGTHVKADLTKIVANARSRYPRTTFESLPPSGEVEAVIDAISTWLADNA